MEDKRLREVWGYLTPKTLRDIIWDLEETFKVEWPDMSTPNESVRGFLEKAKRFYADHFMTDEEKRDFEE